MVANGIAGEMKRSCLCFRSTDTVAHTAHAALLAVRLAEQETDKWVCDA